MRTVPKNVLNPGLYIKARKLADRTYARHSAYKSMFIAKTYKTMGGTYTGKNAKSTARWRKEKWIQVIPFLTSGKYIECGHAKDMPKVCRPLIRINSKTPITLPELIKLHSKKELLQLAKKKHSDMDGRIFWKIKKFYPSTN